MLNQMVEYKHSSLDQVFHALADPTRRGMLDSLREGEKAVSALAKPFEMTLAGASKHVQVLVDAGLVLRRKQGRSQLCSLNQRALMDAYGWLKRYSEFWNRRLDQLAQVLEEEKKSDE